MIQPYVGFSIGVLFSASLHAQAPAADPVEGKASLGYLATSGNTESTNANAALNLIWRRALWSHEFDLSAVQADTAGITTAEARFVEYSARRDVGEQSYMVANLDWEQDEFSAFEDRLALSFGYGRHFLSTAKHTLDGELGLGTREARRRTAALEQDSIIRASLAYQWRFTETAGFTQSLVIDSGSSNTATETLSELRTGIFGSLALVLSYRVRRNSSVTPGVGRTDRNTAISLEYAF